MIRPVNIVDGLTVEMDLLTHRLTKSVQASCKHNRKECISTSESGSNTAYARFRCLDCGEFYTVELLPAEYQRFIEEEYTEPLP